MIDYFALALSHALLVLAVWRMLQRADLDREGGDEVPQDEVLPAPPQHRLKLRGDA